MPIVGPDQVVSLHTSDGKMVYQFTPQDYSQLGWTRDQNNASTCDLLVPQLQSMDRLPDIAPWVHWLTAWDGSDSSLLWTGPIQKVTSSFSGLTLNAKDHGAYLARTRSPMSKQWEYTDPALIAEELWLRMIDIQGLKIKPVVRTDSEGRQYDFQAVENDKMLDQTISDLVNLGMMWTVVSGVPLLGPISKEPLTTLSDKDFLGQNDLQLIRDGSILYNDVLVKAEGSEIRAGIPYYGQQLQTIKTFDMLSGVSNVSRAATSYVGLVGRVRTLLTMPSGAMLHPDAEVTIEQLMPSARFIIETQGVRQLMQLSQVEVQRQAGLSTVKVTMASTLTYDEIQAIELDTATNDKQSGSGGLTSVTAAR